MKILCLLVLMLSINISAQENKTIEFDSKILSETRTINIYIPKSYNASEKRYPVIYALDGEYTKFAINGTMDYYSFWDKTPECIVVSINQNYEDSLGAEYKRWSDCSYSWSTGLPNSKGSAFKAFIVKELIPYIDSSFRTTNFRTIIGHSFTANFVNYFLFDKEPVFTGYIAISPYYASNGLESLKTIVESLKSPIFYFVASGENDLSGHKKSVSEFDKEFSRIKNKNFIYKNFDSKNNQATHYTIFPIALPSAIEHLFSAYTNMNDADLKILMNEENKISYLIQRYEKMKSIYGIEIPIREDDLNLVSYAISKKKQWVQLKEIAELTIEIYPESFLGYWTLGEYFEKTGNFSSALEQFELGMTKLGDDVLNLSDFQKDIDRVKSKIK